MNPTPSEPLKRGVFNPDRQLKQLTNLATDQTTSAKPKPSSEKQTTLSIHSLQKPMAAKMLLSPHPHFLPSLPFHTNTSKLHPCHRSWHQVHPPTPNNKLRVSLHDSSDFITHHQHELVNPYSLLLLTETSGYSLASYYTSLGLFVISVPGLWSLIKRSVKSKIVKKTFIDEEGKKAPNLVAGEILSFFTRNNFAVIDRGETITFEGIMVPSRGQAALLTFCTCISLASVALVLTITVPDVGNNWFWLTTLSPLAGAYYWTRASRKEQIKVKLIVKEDGTLSEIVVQGDDQQVEQMRKELKFSEKGMVYVKGLFET